MSTRASLINTIKDCSLLPISPEKMEEYAKAYTDDLVTEVEELCYQLKKQIENDEV
jgi:hypothetical protein